MPVRIRTVGRRDLSAALDAQGTLHPYKEVNVAAKLTGRVEELLVDVGDPIRAGDVLLRIEEEELLIAERQAAAAVAAAQANLARVKAGARPQEIELAKAQAAQAEANLSQAEAHYERMRALFASGAISESQYEQSRTQYDVAQASWLAAQSQLQLVLQGPTDEEVAALEAALAQAEASLALTQLHLKEARVASPLTGIVAGRFVEMGDFVGAGMPLARIVQTDPIVMRIEVGGRDVVSLRPGLEARITIDALPGRSYTGRVSHVEAVADSNSRLFGVKIEAPNAEGVLRAGMAARVEILTAQAKDVVAVPDSALMTEAGETYLFVVEGETARRRVVQVGVVAQGWAEIKEGLSPGEQVVVVGHNFLADGARVQVVERIGE